MTSISSSDSSSNIDTICVDRDRDEERMEEYVLRSISKALEQRQNASISSTISATDSFQGGYITADLSFSSQKFASEAKNTTNSRLASPSRSSRASMDRRDIRDENGYRYDSQVARNPPSPAERRHDVQRFKAEPHKHAKSQEELRILKTASSESSDEIQENAAEPAAINTILETKQNGSTVVKLTNGCVPPEYSREVLSEVAAKQLAEKKAEITKKKHRDLQAKNLHLRSHEISNRPSQKNTDDNEIEHILEIAECEELSKQTLPSLTMKGGKEYADDSVPKESLMDEESHCSQSTRAEQAEEIKPSIKFDEGSGCMMFSYRLIDNFWGTCYGDDMQSTCTLNTQSEIASLIATTLSHPYNDEEARLTSKKMADRVDAAYSQAFPVGSKHCEKNFDGSGENQEDETNKACPSPGDCLRESLASENLSPRVPDGAKEAKNESDQKDGSSSNPLEESKSCEKNFDCPRENQEDSTNKICPPPGENLNESLDSDCKSPIEQTVKSSDFAQVMALSQHGNMIEHNEIESKDEESFLSMKHNPSKEMSSLTATPKDSQSDTFCCLNPSLSSSSDCVGHQTAESCEKLAAVVVVTAMEEDIDTIKDEEGLIEERGFIGMTKHSIRRGKKILKAMSKKAQGLMADASEKVEDGYLCRQPDSPSDDNTKTSQTGKRATTIKSVIWHVPLTTKDVKRHAENAHQQLAPLVELSKEGASYVCKQLDPELADWGEHTDLLFGPTTTKRNSHHNQDHRRPKAPKSSAGIDENLSSNDWGNYSNDSNSDLLVQAAKLCDKHQSNNDDNEDFIMNIAATKREESPCINDSASHDSGPFGLFLVEGNNDKVEHDINCDKQIHRVGSTDSKSNNDELIRTNENVTDTNRAADDEQKGSQFKVAISVSCNTTSQDYNNVTLTYEETKDQQERLINAVKSHMKNSISNENFLRV